MPEVVVLKSIVCCGLCIDICPKKILQIGTVANQKAIIQWKLLIKVNVLVVLYVRLCVRT